MTGASRATERQPGGEALESELLRLFVDSVVDRAVFTLDAGGTVVGWNREAGGTAGWTRNAIVGRHVSALYPPEEVRAGTPWQELRRAEVDGQSERAGWQVREDGSRFRGSVMTFGLRRPGGGVAGFVALAQDLEGPGADGASPTIPLERREHIAGLLRTGAIRTLFSVGMDLQAVAAHAADAGLRARLQAAVDDLDRGIRELRSAVLGS